MALAGSCILDSPFLRTLWSTTESGHIAESVICGPGGSRLLVWLLRYRLGDGMADDFPGHCRWKIGQGNCHLKPDWRCARSWTRHYPSSAVVYSLGCGSAHNSGMDARLCPYCMALILAGYVGGRICEGDSSSGLRHFDIFIWRPIDSLAGSSLRGEIPT